MKLRKFWAIWGGGAPIGGAPLRSANVTLRRGDEQPIYYLADFSERDAPFQ